MKPLTTAAISTALACAVMACSPKTPDKPAEKPAAEAPATPAPAPSKYKEVESPGAHRDGTLPWRTDTVEVSLAAAGDPGKGHEIEYMVNMKAGQVLTYSWDVPDATNFWSEFHGHTNDAVTFYKKAAGAKHEGLLTAPFDGIHGWYFENRTAKPVVVRLRISGFYERIPTK